MLTKTIERDGMTLVVRRGTRQNHMLRRYYWRHFANKHPQFKDILIFDQIDNVEPLVDALSEDERSQYIQIMEFTLISSCVIHATGFPFRWPEPGELPNEKWIDDAFAHYMAEDPEEGIWHDLDEAYVSLHEPVTPPVIQPTEMVKALINPESDQYDPNS